MEDEQWAQKVHVCGQSEAIWEGLMSARKNGDDVSMNAMNNITQLTL
jgi:hypothetical protein